VGISEKGDLRRLALPLAIYSIALARVYGTLRPSLSNLP